MGNEKLRTDGLVVRVGSDQLSRRSLVKLSRDIVCVLPGQWIIVPMGDGSRDFHLQRRQKWRNPTVSQAFDFARILSAHRDVEDCEPALVVPTIGPDEMRRRNQDDSRIRSALPAELSSGTSADDDQHLACSSSHQWHHSMCSIPSAWLLPRPSGGKARGEGILIGHPDTGYSDHPEITDEERLLKDRGFDFQGDDSDPRDPLTGTFAGHGTSTSSVIMSGVTGQIRGVAPRAQLMPLRVTDNVVLLSFTRLASAIRFAADNGVHVISISLGGPVASRFLERAVQYAISRGVIVVCAAGNVWPFVVFPARLDEVIAVAACNCRKKTWVDSASGADVDITAPGESVWRAEAATSGFGISRSSGTSYATAIAAGVAALWLAHHGRERLIARFGISSIPLVFKELLMTAGFDRPSGWDTRNFGAGVLNAEKLLRAPLPSTPPAAGFRSLRLSESPRTLNQIDRLLELFPQNSPDDIRAGLSRFLRVPSSDLNLALRDVADEIAWHATTNMTFRQMICRSRAEVSRRSIRLATDANEGQWPTLSRQLRKLAGT